MSFSSFQTHELSPSYAEQGSVASYALGFIGSLVFTLLAYGVVVGHLASTSFITALIVFLALLQLGMQMRFFLHVGKRGTGWNTAALIFALIVVSIVVSGSLWIMFNLNARMMPSLGQMLRYMQNQSW